MNIHEKIFGLTLSAKECLQQLFFYGPTWDGNIISKNGRGELIRAGLASRYESWAFITEAGMKYAIDNLLMNVAKDRWENQKRRKTA